jgi:hypothetical protein
MSAVENINALMSVAQTVLIHSRLQAIYVLDITNCMLWRAVVRWKYLQR